VAKRAWRKGSPDHEYYLKNKERIGANRAALSIARKLIRRAHHTLRELGEEAISEPINASRGAWDTQTRRKKIIRKAFVRGAEPNRSDES
jgi:hypothetical protein